MTIEAPVSPMNSTSDAPCLLTLVLPQALEDSVLDLLQSCPELENGYTVLPAQGLGAGTTLSTVMEQVQGRARRVVVQAVLSTRAVPAVLSRLQSQVRSAQVSYWIQPLLGGGTLA